LAAYAASTAGSRRLSGAASPAYQNPPAPGTGTVSAPDILAIASPTLICSVASFW
jgi:hypothetical protein